MALELSSNWKKLQAKIKAESQVSSEQKLLNSTAKKAGTKRKVEGGSFAVGRAENPHITKKQKVVVGKAGKARLLKTTTTTTKPETSKPQARKKPHAEKERQPRMGGAQSSKITDTLPNSVSPSLALWAADNDISSEDIAEAYNLGIKNNALLTSSNTRPNAGLSADVELGKYLGIDCEMVGVGEGGYESSLARVSVVDFHGRQVYDSFVRQRRPVVDWRTRISGVRPRDMATARTFDEVQSQIRELLAGRALVGHDVKHDLAALELEHPPRQMRDTARFQGFKKYGHGPKPALRVLAREILGVEIQDGQHSSVEDARVAMLLFRRFKSQFDVEHQARFSDSAPSGGGTKSSSRQKKPKKKKRKN